MHPGIIALIVVGSIFVLLTLLNLKRGRPDGTFIKRIHPYRRMMFYIMPTRNGSVVYFDSYVDAAPVLDYIKKAREGGKFHVDVTHCVVGAAMRSFQLVPRMDRFVAGKRLYARKRTAISFSMKRKKLDTKAKLAVVKLEYNEGETFEQLCRRINGDIDTQRSDQKTYDDKELGLFALVPRPVLRILYKIFQWLDYYNLLPGFFIRDDKLHCSLFVANLGSLKMGAGYHHLYEWGTCPLFLMVGQIEDRPVVKEGEVVVQKTLHLRYTYDERIDDGLNSRFGIDAIKTVLENPFRYLGCLKEDGSDTKALYDEKEAKAA